MRDRVSSVCSNIKTAFWGFEKNEICFRLMVWGRIHKRDQDQFEIKFRSSVV